MSRNIVWVDEDERIWAPERRALVGLGYEVTSIGDAGAAWEYLEATDCDQLDVLILDVMLLQGADESFSDEKTNRGLNTGIVLAEKIIGTYPDMRDKIVLFSRASKRELIAYIEKKSKEMKIKYIRKGPNTQGRHFIKWLAETGLIEVG